MSERRKALETLAAGTVGLAVERSGLERLAPAPCAPAAAGRNAGHLPNVVVTSHEGERARFYDDLIAGRVVMINCMSIAHHAHYPVTANLAAVQRHLGRRLGRELFMYSLTVDPEHDTVEALSRFAHRHGARRGWLFLTGAAADVELLRRRLFVDNVGHHPGAAGRDCSLGLVRYGNEAAGVWGACPAKADPAWIARRLDWVLPRERAAGDHRRRGPAPLPAHLRAGGQRT